HCVVLLKNQLRAFPERRILEVKASTWIRAVAPNRVITIHGVVPPKFSKSSNIFIALLCAELLYNGESSRTRAPDYCPGSGFSIRRLLIRCKLVLDRPGTLQGFEKSGDLRMRFWQ